MKRRGSYLPWESSIILQSLYKVWTPGSNTALELLGRVDKVDGKVVGVEPFRETLGVIY